MEGDRSERLAVELSLLESMYPEQLRFDPRGREVTYSQDSSTLKLRLPDEYLQTALPEVLVAVTGTKVDLRNRLKKLIVENCSPGEEVLDSVTSSFNDLVDSTISADHAHVMGRTEQSADDELTAKACVIVWLHHLLNTNKRKQVLSPATPGVCGISKPGYPGVLVFSGPAVAVHRHVDELRRLNWQAFQVRLDSDEEWSFEHGTGIIEVEAMKDVVTDIDECRKEEFMEAMRMK